MKELYKGREGPTMIDFEERAKNISYGPIIEDDIARLFKVLLHVTKAKRVLEIGTSIGFSTTILASVVKQYGGRVTTIDVDPKIIEEARRNFDREGVSDVIDIKIGKGEEVLKQLEDESFDIVFQDSSKQGYPLMLNDCLRVLRKGGLLLVDDTLWPAAHPKKEWDDSVKGIHEFNRKLLEANVESAVLTIGEGCTVAVKL